MAGQLSRRRRDGAERDARDVEGVAREAAASPGHVLEPTVLTQMQRNLAFGDLARGRAPSPTGSSGLVSDPQGPEEAEAAARAAAVVEGGPVPGPTEQGQPADMSAVQVHTDGVAASAADRLDAAAFTVGNHIVFGEGQYRPQDTEGQRLLAHELSHALTPSSTLVRRQQSKSSAKAAAVDDYADASSYITDFYISQSRLLTDVYLARNAAVEEFADRSKAPLPGDAKEPPMTTIKFVLGLTPGSQEIMLAVELWEKLWSVASEVAERAGPKPEQSDPMDAASEAREGTLTPHLVINEALAKKQLKDREELRRRRDTAGGGSSATKGTSLLAQTRASVGEIPHYSAEVIRTFGMNYELDLYRRYYSVNGGISRKQPYSFARGPYTTYEIVAVPDAVVDRVVALYKALRRVPKVSIDPRYNPKHAILVAHMIDLDVPVINYLPTLARGGGTVTAEERKQAITLHTSDDLQQPYRGERYQEVK